MAHPLPVGTLIPLDQFLAEVGIPIPVHAPVPQRSPLPAILNLRIARNRLLLTSHQQFLAFKTEVTNRLSEVTNAGGDLNNYVTWRETLCTIASSSTVLPPHIRTVLVPEGGVSDWNQQRRFACHALRSILEDVRQSPRGNQSIRRWFWEALDLIARMVRISEEENIGLEELHLGVEEGSDSESD